MSQVEIISLEQKRLQNSHMGISIDLFVGNTWLEGLFASEFCNNIDNKPIESLRLKLCNQKHSSCSLSYCTEFNGKWDNWISSEASGIIGSPITGFACKFDVETAKSWSINYRLCDDSGNWSKWGINGEKLSLAKPVHDIALKLVQEDYEFNTALECWDFNQAEKRLEELVQENFIYYFPRYCTFLADIGKLDALDKAISNKSAILPTLCKNNKEFGVVRMLYNTLNRLNNDSTDVFFARLYQLVKLKNTFEVVSKLKSDWKNKIKADLSAENNMVLNFIFNELVKTKMLDTDLAVLFIEHLTVCKNINSKRKRVLLVKLIDYFILNLYYHPDFYKLADIWYNHIQKIFTILHTHFSTEFGGMLYQQKLYFVIKSNNNLNLIRKNQARIAICISGMYRANPKPLESIYKNLAVPLNADVFLFAWDEQQDWLGAGGSGYFWQRLFAKTPPKNLSDINFFKNNFGAICDAMMTEHLSPLQLDSLLEKFKFTSFSIENQDDFLQRYNIDATKFSMIKRKGNLNQIKMFYGIYKAFLLMRSYEIAHNIHYDYVIRLRPDVAINNSISIAQLSKLDASSVYIANSGNVGIADWVFYASYPVYEEIANLFYRSINADRLSPFLGFPNHDAHALLFDHLLNSNILCKKSELLHAHLSFNTSDQGVKIPNLKQALIHDINPQKRVKFPEECKFLEELLVKYV